MKTFTKLLSWTQAYAMASTMSKHADVTWSNSSKDLSIATQ